MEKHEPGVYQAIIEADRISQDRFHGHGSALAQPYNHMIMPLASAEDKRTQIIWGIKDFEYRFRRKPKGMWLPETAVDLESLEIMAEQKIEFTILEPRQAKRVRKIGGSKWSDVSGGRIDPRKPYLCRLPSGKTIHLFFYDGPVSRDIAFGKLLESGEHLASRLMRIFSDNEKPQLAHIATDGESYGHHHRYGEMALSYALHHIESNKLAEIINYSAFLQRHPPAREVEVFEQTSWSCGHGVERWKSDCGCHTGMHAGWTQKWRAPLRQAMDWLRDQLIPLYEREMSSSGIDPWRARNDYIDVILDRSVQNVEGFFLRFGIQEFSKEEKSKILKLFEMQRFAMLMYTSCGWFFDEVSRIETLQVMQYASRAMQLLGELNGQNLEAEYLKILEQAPSNILDIKNGRRAWEWFVQPSRIDHIRVAAHYAVSSLFTEYPETIKIFSYMAKSELYDVIEVGIQKLALGKARIYSDITWDDKEVCFAVLHLGDHNLLGGVSEAKDHDCFTMMRKELKDIFLQSDIAEVIRLMDKHYGTHNYFLWHLFRDEQRKIFNKILDSKVEEIETYYRKLYAQHYPMMKALKGIQIPLPKALATPLEFVINTDLRKWLEQENLNFEQLKRLVEESQGWPIELDKATIGYFVSERIIALMEKLSQNPHDTSLLENVIKIFEIFEVLSLDLDLWRAQNVYFSVASQHFESMKGKADREDPAAQKWVELFNGLEHYLHVRKT
jgi:alpha-amylase/alpha-mannosidase (GH57 family)